MKAHLILQEPRLAAREFPVSQVVIYDALGNPLSAICEISPMQFVIEDCRKEQEFNHLLNQLGIRRQVTCQTISSLGNV